MEWYPIALWHVGKPGSGPPDQRLTIRVGLDKILGNFRTNKFHKISEVANHRKITSDGLFLPNIDHAHEDEGHDN